MTVNEPFFEGHFPSRPIMPGVLIVESMAQTAGCLVLHTLGTDADNKLVYFMTIDDARFRRPVTPGDQMRVHVEQQRSRGNVFVQGRATVDDVLCAEATFSAMIVEQEQERRPMTAESTEIHPTAIVDPAVLGAASASASIAWLARR